MASCLGCGSRRARVLHALTSVVVRDEGRCLVVSRVTRRLAFCPACGEHRQQTITDDGVTRRRKIVDDSPLPLPRH